MAKTILEETNGTYEKLVKLLKEYGVKISHPVTVYTSNKEKDAWVCCNYTGPGIHVELDEIDFNDFRGIDPEIMKHCPTWSYIDKKKNNKIIN